MPGDDLYDRMRDELSATPRVRRQLGVFLAPDGNLAIVQVGTEQIRVPMAGYQPHPNTPVWLETQNGRTVCAGSSYQFSPYGTVIASPANDMVRVQVDDGPELTLPYRAGITLTSGMRVEINPVTRVVQGQLSMTPTTPTPGGGGGGGTPFSNLLIQATDSGSTNGGAWWTNDVYTMSSTSGAWFYGEAARSALIGVTAITSAEIYLPLRSDATGFRQPMRLHIAATKPASGFVTFGDAYTAAAWSGWVPIPTAWLTYLQSNYGGIGFPTHPNTGAIWAGRGADAMSGAIRVSGTR